MVNYVDKTSQEWLCVQSNKMKGSVTVFDPITIIACFLFYVLSNLLADNVCHFEQTYVDEFKDKESFNPRYAFKRPVIPFAIIAFFNFVSIFWVADKVQFFAYSFIQVFIMIIGVITFVHKRMFPKVFEIIASIVSILLFIGIVLINVL